MKEFITCSCQTEGIYIVQFAKGEEVYLSFFSRGFNPVRMSWKDKIRYIWKLLTTNSPFEDELVLNKKDTKKLIAVLNKCVQ
jgi:hypothetical protein